MLFSKVDPRPRRMPKRVFLVQFEHVLARFGPLKIQKCFQTGLFLDQNWVQNGSKMRFSKNDAGVQKQVK